jgi:hypothetical protein
MEQVAAALLVWIAAHSSYPVAQLAPPPVVLLTPQALIAQVERDEGVAAQHGSDLRLQGYFKPDSAGGGTVYVIRPEDTPGAAAHADPADNPLFRERLLHELVHYAQAATGRHFRCRSQGEVDAYALGGQYLKEHGVPDPLPERRLVARMVQMC